jgi:hypothetical protein
MNRKRMLRIQRARGARSSLSIAPPWDFDQWWEAYPHKVGKGAARKAYQKARATVSADELLAGVARYIADTPSDRPWCNPATWLNQERWTDEPAPPPERDGSLAEATRRLLVRAEADRITAPPLAYDFDMPEVPNTYVPAATETVPGAQLQSERPATPKKEESPVTEPKPDRKPTQAEIDFVHELTEQSRSGREQALAEAEAERLAQLEGAREALAALKRARPLAMPPEIREQLAGAGR